MAEEISTATDAVEPGSTIEIVGGSSPASFDELEAVDRHAKTEEKVKKSEVKEAAKEAAKEVLKKKDASSEASKKGGDKDGRTPDDKSTAEGEDGKEKSAAQDVKPVKTLKVKIGDEDKELPLDAKIPVKVSGEEKEVTLEELRHNYAGKVDWSRKYSELDKERKTFTKDREMLNSTLNEVFDLSKKDAFGAMLKFVELGGLDPIKYRKDFLDSIFPALEKLQGMDENERRALDREFELNYRQQALEAREAKTREAQEFEQFQEQTLKQVEQHGLSPDEFFETYADLARRQSEGQFKQQLTADVVLQVALTSKTYDQVFDAVEAVGAKLEDAKVQKLVTTLANSVKSGELRLADVKDTVMEFLKVDRSEKLSQKVAKSSPDKVQKPKPKAPVNPGHEPLTFDEL